MNYSLNTPVEYDNNLHINCRMERIFSVRRHFSKAFSIFFLLQGSAHLTKNDEHIFLENEDIVLINSNEIFEIYSHDSALFLIIEFDPSLLFDKNIQYYYDLNSKKDTHSKEDYYKVKLYAAKLMKSVSLQESMYSRISIFYELIAFLQANFAVNKEQIVETESKYTKRIQSITSFIEENFRKGLTLKEVADHEFLSVSYLSAFFEKHIGKGFYDYYNNVRLNSAVDELLSTKHNIEEIAINNGFNDSRAFVRIFKEKYNTLPSQYRQEHSIFEHTSISHKVSVSKDDVQMALKILGEYYEMQKKANANPVSQLTSDVTIPEVSILKEPTIIKNVIGEMITIAASSDLLLSDIQAEIIKLNQKMHFKYISLRYIFDDALNVFSISDEGIPSYNFVLIDKIIDFVLLNNLIPFIEIAFVPKALAKNPNNYILNNRFLVSYPKDMTSWCNLTNEFINHLINKYSFREVNNWLFSIWNSPGSGPKLFGFDTENQFNYFHSMTYKAIKKALPSAKIGCPTFITNKEHRLKWLMGFLKYCNKENITFDFVPIHYYAEYFDVTPEESDAPNPILNYEEDHLLNSIHDTKRIFEFYNHSNIPFLLSAFNLCVSQRQLLHDTRFLSAYFAKNYIDTLGLLDSFSASQISDLTKLTKAETELFYGGSGLVTNTGIPKSTYNTVLLLEKLYDDILEKGNGYCITKSNRKVRILLYNFINVNPLVARGEFLINSNERYSSFDMEKKLHIQLSILDLKEDNYQIKHYIINSKFGSSYDLFTKMGAINLNSTDEIEYLKNMSCPGIAFETKETVKNKLQIDCILEPFEVRLIEFKIKE